MDAIKPIEIVLNLYNHHIDTRDRLSINVHQYNFRRRSLTFNQPERLNPDDR